MIQLHKGDCLKVLKRLPAGSADAVVTDPPAGIGFMGKAAIAEGFGFVGIEQDPESHATAQRRIKAAQAAQEAVA